MITEGTRPVSTTPSRDTDARTLLVDEASLYDRQIRLWGLEAQNR